MTPYETFVSQIKRHEGTVKRDGRHVLYTDSLGIYTIGWGRNIQAKGLSDEEASFLLNSDILEAAEALGSHLPWTDDLDSARRHALLNMTFNMGINGLLTFKNTLADFRAGRFESASERMLQSKWATQVKSRAIELSNQVLTGVEKP